MNWGKLGRQLFWPIAWSICGIFIIPFLRPKVRGFKNVPRRGPVLLLANHNFIFDPVVVPWCTFRRCHGVGTDQILRVPVFGKIVPWLSVIPFAKGMRDPGAMEEIGRRAADGQVILIFPEGTRSWTGALCPVKPSIGKLAKRLNVPVVVCRVKTSHLQWPRWAKYPRLVPVELEYLPATVYDQSLSDEEVTEDLRQKMTIDPEDVAVPPRSAGARLAWGLPPFLWACPNCRLEDGLEVDTKDGDRVVCKGCEGAWRLDIGGALTADGGPSETTNIHRAHQDTLDHFGALPISNHAAFEAEGVALECEDTKLGIVHRGVREPDPIGQGRLRLHRDHLTFIPTGSDTVTWTLDFKDIHAVMIQVGGRLQIRTPETNFEIIPKGQSPLKWRHFVLGHLRAYREAQALGDAPKG